MKRLVVLLSIFAVLCADGKVRKHARIHKAHHKIQKVEKKTTSPRFLDAKQAVLIDFDTGEVLYGLNADERCTPSSMTKLMTVYILFSELRKGNLHLEDTLPVSEKAQSMEGSRSFFQAGTEATVEDLVRSIIVHSGNDACVVVAEAISGDSDLFAEEMNRYAEKFGLQNSHFMNPAGLPDDDHYSTVHDIAIIAKKLIEDFPEYYHYFSEQTFTVNGITQPNRNTLLGNSMGVDGLKTGHTNAGGYALAASTSINGKRLIAVVNGCDSTKLRAQSCHKLLTMGYSEFVKLRTIKAGRPITSMKVWLGTVGDVNLCTHEDVALFIPKKYRSTVKIEAKIKEPLEAPIKVGQKAGTLVYRYGDYVSRPYTLFTCNEVARANWFDRAKVSINYLLFGNSYFQPKPSENVPNEK